MREIGTQVAVAVGASPDLHSSVLPTAEEAGFKWTINAGQVAQIVGFGWFAIKYYTSIVVRHAVQTKDIETLKMDVSTLKDDIKEIKSDLKQLPTIVQGVHRNETRNAAILGHVKEIPSKADSLLTDESFFDKIAERMIELGKVKD
ncbi:MAG: hypothetical protein ACRYGG_07410 [Janthinobacterium lividum]